MKLKSSGDFVREKCIYALRNSSLPYAGSLVLTIMLAAYANYALALLYPPNITFKGQVPAIVIPFIGFPITFVLWLFYKGRPSTSKLLQTLFFGLIAVWVIHFIIIHIHHDMYVHTLWLFVPTLLLLALKTPSSDDAWTLIRTLAWTAVLILVLTRLLEMLNFLPQSFVPDVDLAQWEREHYWLPFADHMGIASRWTGPFGSPAKTGFVAVFIVIVAIAKWRRSNAVLLLFGVLGMVIAGGRGVYLSALAGALVLLVFSRVGWLNRLSTTMRFAILVVPVLIVAQRFLASPTGSTGRIEQGGIWDSFLTLWRTDIWLGVGHSGIWTSGTVHPLMDAHSIFLQELVEFGVIGFVTQFGVLSIALVLTLAAAVKGRPAGLGVLTSYLVAASTELLNDGWQNHTFHTIIVLLAAITSVPQTRGHLRGSRKTSSVAAQVSQSK